MFLVMILVFIASLFIYPPLAVLIGIAWVAVLLARSESNE